MSEYDFIIRS